MTEFSFEQIKAIMADKESEYHLPPEQFKRKREWELHDKIKGKVVIFLDLKYLIIFRELLYGNGRPNVVEADLGYYTDILNMLIDLKKENKVVCIISSSIIDEMNKIEEERRKATARVFDELGEGIVFNTININLNELANVDRAISAVSLIPRYHISTVFESNPVFSRAVFAKFNKSPNAALNIAFDVFSSQKLEDYVKGSYKMHNASGEILANIFNQTKNQNTENVRFQSMIIRELNSIISSYKKMKLRVLVNEIDAEKHLDHFIKRAPHMYLMAAIHAAMTVNKDQRYKSNDYYDLLHSCSAVGYANLFLTEKRFHHLLKSAPVNSTKLFKAKILSDPNQILQQLKPLADA